MNRLKNVLTFEFKLLKTVCKTLLHLPRVERSSEKILLIILHFFRFLCSYVFNMVLSVRTVLMNEDLN